MAYLSSISRLLRLNKKEFIAATVLISTFYEIGEAGYKNCRNSPQNNFGKEQWTRRRQGLTARL